MKRVYSVLGALLVATFLWMIPMQSQACFGVFSGGFGFGFGGGGWGHPGWGYRGYPSDWGGYPGYWGGYYPGWHQPYRWNAWHPYW